jgi:tetratricopeptide (TPR) repeat protein
MQKCDECQRLRESLYSKLPQPVELAAAHFIRGRVFLDQGDPVNAEPEFDAAVKLVRDLMYDPYRYGQYRYFLGECRRQIGKLEEAEEDLPEGFRALAMRGKCSDPPLNEAGMNVVDLFEQRDNQQQAEFYRSKLNLPERPHDQAVEATSGGTP